MHTGVVKQFSDTLGYGFIRLEGLSEDVFVHQTAIKAEGFRTLYAGEKVQFQIKKDEKGLKAVNVVRVTDLEAGQVTAPPAVTPGDTEGV